MSEFDVFELLDWVESFNSSKDVYGKLAIRDRIHSALTKKVLGEISHPLTEAINMFSGSNENIDWYSIESVAGLEDYVRVVGFSLPIPGTSIIVEGQPILITEENNNKYKKVIRFVLPTKLIASDNVDLLASFVADLSAIAAISTDRDMENLLKSYLYNNLQRLTDSPFYYKILDKATKPSEAFGFNISDLNDEQVKSLFLLGPRFDENEGKVN